MRQDGIQALLWTCALCVRDVCGLREASFSSYGRTCVHHTGPPLQREPDRLSSFSHDDSLSFACHCLCFSQSRFAIQKIHTCLSASPSAASHSVLSFLFHPLILSILLFLSFPHLLLQTDRQTQVRWYFCHYEAHSLTIFILEIVYRESNSTHKNMWHHLQGAREGVLKLGQTRQNEPQSVGLFP